MEVFIFIIILSLFLSFISWATDKFNNSKAGKITNDVLDTLEKIASGMNQAASEMEKNVSEWARKRQAEREGITQIEINNKASRYGNKNGPETKKMNAWNEWKQRNRAKLNEHPYGYEEMFVNMVLMQIGEIQPADVISQYHFCDDSGKNRYIDFVIENKSKNWLLPIELDGYSKMQMGYEKFDDFLVRQNALIKRFSIVLRYSNNKFRDYPTLVIREIKETLILQQQGKIISRPAIERLNEEIEKLKQFLAKTKQESDKKIIKIIENHEKQIKIFEEKENELKSIGDLLQAKKLYDKYLSMETRILSKLDNVLIQRDFESFISSGYTLSSLDNVWDIVKIEYKNISSKDKETLKEVFAFFLSQINKRFKEAKYGLVQVEVGEDFDAVNQVDLSQNSKGRVTECVFYGYGFLKEKENPDDEDVVIRRIKNPLVLTV